MRITRIFIFCIILLSTGIGSAAAQVPARPANPPPPPRAGLTLTSTAFADCAVVPTKYTGVDPNPVSPQMAWTNVLPNTVTFSLILHDPDSNRDVLHWMIFNIPATVRELPEGLPATAQLANGATQGKNQGDTIGYRALGGGTGPYHHYIFELYALDTKLALGPDATRTEVLKAMEGHILEKSVLVGRFRRP